MFGYGNHFSPIDRASGDAFEKNISELEKIFSASADLESRTVALAGELFCRVAWLDGCASAQDTAELVIRPLRELNAVQVTALSDNIRGGAVWACTVRELASVAELAGLMAAGYVAVLAPDGAIFAFDLKSGARRGVELPTVEKALLGAKDAFAESIRVNTALVRRRIRTESLHLREFTLGERTRTTVDLLYTDAADGAMLTALCDRLEGAKLDTLLSVGELEGALTEPPRGVFPRFLHTERPDRFAQGLLRGQAGLLIDGLPVGLLLPGTLPELLSVSEDASRHAVVARFLLVLRYISLFLSLFLPAVYVAAATRHQELIPLPLLLSIIRAKQEVPFSTAAEVIGMLLSFELLQEAGIRLPDSTGQTVSIIGALIVGQSAVEAQVISPVAVIVVAMAGIGGYTQPSQELSTAFRLWRLLLVPVAALLGFYGVMAAAMLLLWRLCDTETLGRAYLSPLCDRRWRKK